MIDKINMNGLKAGGYALVFGTSSNKLNGKKVRVIKHHGIAINPSNGRQYDFWIVDSGKYVPSINLIPFGVSVDQDEYLNGLLEYLKNELD